LASQQAASPPGQACPLLTQHVSPTHIVEQQSVPSMQACVGWRHEAGRHWPLTHVRSSPAQQSALSRHRPPSDEHWQLPALQTAPRQQSVSVMHVSVGAAHEHRPPVQWRRSQQSLSSSQV
jgi:hypothetical protein